MFYQYEDQFSKDYKFQRNHYTIDKPSVVIDRHAFQANNS